jgi:hypothetical protein
MLYCPHMIGRIIGGLFGAAVGFLLVWKSNWFAENFGSISSWADSHLGGMRVVYKILGCIIIFIAFLVVTNLHVAFFKSVFGGLFGAPQPGV